MAWRRTVIIAEDHYPRGPLSVVLAAGQIFAREVGLSRAEAGAPLLLTWLLETERDTSLGRGLEKILGRDYGRKPASGRTGSLQLARPIILDWHRHLKGDYGQFCEGPPGIGPGLLALLGAAYFLEGMPNGFGDLTKYFALWTPRPDAWLPMACDIESLSTDKEPYFRLSDAKHSRGPCFDTRVSMRPKGMGILGIPPVDTHPAKPPRLAKRKVQAGSTLIDGAQREGSPEHREEKPVPRIPPYERRTPPSRPRPPEDEKPPDVLSIEWTDLRLKDIVLPEEARLELAYLAKLMTTRAGENPILLFHGPPGTGKTHAARCLAGEVGKPLGAASLDQLLMKWHGDTERAFRKAFEDAAQAGAMLLLDEADAILCDRRGQTQSWQISQVNNLLKLMEAPGVPLILCTNFLKSLDSAVHRRVQHLVEFPLPGYDERLGIWDAELARQGVGDLPVKRSELAEIPLSGGLISNAVCQFVRRKTVFGEAFAADTATLLALARKEQPKMDGECILKVVGFTCPSPVGEEETPL